ncbi:hypothetical protein E1287_01450 [Actinomadura sp. KC06]|uniref:hypothetical protein n=1 Tax=Actinomadura sp. KC06 TaxID=2530369 RepID=UPI001053E99F|nr:hypothetical protein [Actinomadura sp. KC06]TDD40210.1 hypothetical protein E1287_01450 [Actinomadura sp. KC06]
MKASIHMSRRPMAALLAALILLTGPALHASPALAEGPAAQGRAPSPGPAGPTAGPTLPVLAQAKFNPADAKNSNGSDRTGAAAKINGFKADGQGLGVLYWTLRNESDTSESLGPGKFAAAGRWGESVIQPSGVRIVYEGQRHATLFHENWCLCYRTPPGIDYSSIAQGEEIPLSQVFLISPTATHVTVEIPAFHPVPDIPVQR